VASVTVSEWFHATPEQVFAGIRQYTKYPEYLPGVTAIEVLPPKAKGSACRVRYELKLIKTFHYTLNMYEEGPSRIWWDLDESNIMRTSNGSWAIKADGDGTKADYSLEVAFSGLVPQKIVDQVTKANLPAMMRGFQKLVDDTRKSGRT
jgi:ribosome-associated toxin RatA of RatAB toxin-antitoxin module